MPKFIWAVLCRRIITDADSNSLSYIDTVESLSGTKFPANLPPLSIGTLWHKEGEGDEVEMRIVVSDPQGKELHTQTPPKAVFGKEYTRYRVNVALAGVSIVSPGVYEFRVDARKAKGFETVWVLPFEIVASPGIASDQVVVGS